MNNARTTQEISGNHIKTIPVGTPFKMSNRGDLHSSCHGLGITLIWNHEYELFTDPAEIQADRERLIGEHYE